jgi:hypothetical protein
MRIAYGCACVVDCSTFNAKKLGLTSFALASSDCNVFPAVDSNAQANEPLMSSQLSRLHACSWPLDNAHSGQRCNSFSFSYIFSSPSALSILLISKAFEVRACSYRHRTLTLETPRLASRDLSLPQTICPSHLPPSLRSLSFARDLHKSSNQLRRVI